MIKLYIVFIVETVYNFIRIDNFVDDCSIHIRQYSRTRLVFCLFVTFVMSVIEIAIWNVRLV